MAQILTKSQHLNRQLKRELASPSRVCGQRFFSIQEVSRQYQVSPASAYKVIARLVRDGYLESQRGKGYFIKNKPAGFRPIRRRTADAMMLIGSSRPGGERLFEKYVAALEKECGRRGWQLLLARDDPEEIERLEKGRSMAGYLLVGIRQPLSVKLDPSQVLVWTSTWCPAGWSRISPDRPKIARLAFEHLWDLGHQHTALVRLTPGRDIVEDEMGYVLGMRSAYADLGIAWHPEDIITVGSRDGAEIDGNAADGLFDQLRQRGITGIYCMSWPLVLEIYRQAHRRGLRIGKDLSIVGSGGHDALESLNPSPARVRWRFADFASLVTGAMDRLVRGRVLPPRTVLPVFLQPGPSAVHLIADGRDKQNWSDVQN